MVARKDLIRSVATDIAREEIIENGKGSEFVRLATARLNQELRINDMLTRAVVPIKSAEVDLPWDFISAKTIRVENAAGVSRGPLLYATPEDIADYGSARVHPEGPGYFTTYGAILELAPYRAHEDIKLDLRYYREIPELAADDDTNFIVQKYPDLYLKAMLVYGFRYGLEFDASREMEGLLTLEIGRLNERKEAEKYGDGPLIRRPAPKMGGRFS